MINNIDDLRWTMDDMLKKAKENPMPINHDFDTRFRVWIEQILKNRLEVIIQTGGNYEYIQRMINLTISDYDRLYYRLNKEYITNNDKFKEKLNLLLITTKEIIELYENELVS